MRRLIALEGGGAGPLQDMFEEAATAQEAAGITLQQLKVSDLGCVGLSAGGEAFCIS